jgi:hypothetical protein
VPRRKEYEAFTIPGGFEKHAKIMSGYKKIVKRQSRLSDFDVSFLKYYGGYENLLSRCVELNPFGVLNDTRAYFSHNMLKEETILLDGDVIITGYDECSGDHNLFDLAQIIKRYMRTAAAPAIEGLEKIMDAYQSANPLDGRELKALYAILLFPDRFYKSCVKYYSKKRSWTPASFCINPEGIGEDDEGVALINRYFKRQTR